jgi:hypothetical protein
MFFRKFLKPIGLLLLCLNFSHLTFADISDKYPKSPQDRKFDEMDSIFKGGGILVSPSKEGKELKKEKPATKSAKRGPLQNYKLLWQAAIEYLSDRPIISADFNGGTIITDWYNDDNRQQTKINILILGDDINIDNLKVKAYSRILVKNVMKNDSALSEDRNLEARVADDIIKNAREFSEHKQ